MRATAVFILLVNEYACSCKMQPAVSGQALRGCSNDSSAACGGSAHVDGSRADDASPAQTVEPQQPAQPTSVAPSALELRAYGHYCRSAMVDEPLPFAAWRVYRELMSGDAPVGMRTAHQQALEMTAAQLPPPSSAPTAASSPHPSPSLTPSSAGAAAPSPSSLPQSHFPSLVEGGHVRGSCWEAGPSEV